MRKYCKIERESIWDGSVEVDIGIDLRMIPEDSEYDRVCCRCGESLSADGVCDSCNSSSRR